FLDPAVGGEAGLPAVDAETLRVLLREQLPVMRERGLMAAYVIEDTRDGSILGGTNFHHFDPMRDVIEVGYWLFVEARGRGVARRRSSRQRPSRVAPISSSSAFRSPTRLRTVP